MRECYENHKFYLNYFLWAKWAISWLNKVLSRIYKVPVWKIWEEFETFLENKHISKMRKKHLGDQIVINSYVYMLFHCDQSWIKSYLLCYFWRPFPIILETKHNWKSSLGDQPPRFSSLDKVQSWFQSSEYKLINSSSIINSLNAASLLLSDSVELRVGMLVQNCENLNGKSLN